MRKNTQYLSEHSIQYFSESTIFCKSHFYFQINNVSLCICTKYKVVHSCVDGYLDWFHFIAIVNRASISVDVNVSPWASSIDPLGYG